MKFNRKLMIMIICALAFVLVGSTIVVAQEEEKTEFDAVLTAAGDQKIKVIKEIRAITSLGLKEAKELVESAPQPIKEGITKEEAQEIKEKIEAVGGSVELK